MLKLCPFCGSRARLSPEHNYVQCASSKCGFGIVGTKTVAAQDLWNKDAR